MRRSEVSSARYAARVASWSPRPSSQASRRRSAPGQTRRPPPRELRPDAAQVIGRRGWRPRTAAVNRCGVPAARRRRRDPMVVCQPAAVWFPISSPREGAHPRPGARLVRLGRVRAELPVVDLPQPRCVDRAQPGPRPAPRARHPPRRILQPHRHPAPRCHRGGRLREDDFARPWWWLTPSPRSAGRSSTTAATADLSPPRGSPWSPPRPPGSCPTIRRSGTGTAGGGGISLTPSTEPCAIQPSTGRGGPPPVVAADARITTVPAERTTTLYLRSSDIPALWRRASRVAKLSRIHWRSWYCVARLLRWAGCRNLAWAAAQSSVLYPGGKLSRIHWRSWYCVARLLRWAGCRNLAWAAAQSSVLYPAESRARA